MSDFTAATYGDRIADVDTADSGGQVSVWRRT